MIKNLALVGAGVRGIAHAGALSILEERGLTEGIKNVAGTSAGAIVGTLFAMRYDSQDVKYILNSTDFATFEDGGIFDIPQDFTHYGIHKGYVFHNWIKKYIAHQTGNERATFLDFHKKGFRNLVIFATNLNTQSVERFDVNNTPLVCVCDAVRASMSIPFFFRAFMLGSDIYVDGGTVLNYPIEAFDIDEVNPETLGFHFNDIGQPEIRSDLSFGQIAKFVKALTETALNSQNINLGKNVADLKRSVIIDGQGVSATDFKGVAPKKDLLYKSGRDAMMKYLTIR